MKKKSVIIKLALASIFSAIAAFGGYKLYKQSIINNEAIEVEQEQTFVDSGKDELSDELLYGCTLALDSTIKDSDDPAQSNANEDSLLCSSMYVQYGKNTSGEKCLRYVVAVPHLDIDVTFTRTLKYKGTTSKTIKPSVAYLAIRADEKNIAPSEMNNATLGTNYQYFVCYTMRAITDNFAELDVEVTVTDLKKSTDEYENLGTAKAYNAANLAGVTYLDSMCATIDEGTGKWIHHGLKYTYANGGLECNGFSGAQKDFVEIETTLYRRITNTLVEAVPVRSVSDCAFENCTTPTIIHIGENVKSIGDMAFYGCSSLEGIFIPNSIEKIGFDAFSNCPKLNKTDYKNVYYLGNSNNYYLVFVKVIDPKAKSLEVVDECKVMLEDAAKDCASIEWVTLSKDLLNIADNAFNGCTNLNEIEIPNTVKSIGEHAFDACSSLSEIIIPDGVTSIGEYAFAGCSSLTSITLPKGITSLAAHTFEQCESLEFAVLQNGVTSIGENAFFNCQKLESIVIPEGVTSIGENAFADCLILNNVVIPKSVKTIAEKAFSGCEGLSFIRYSGTVEGWREVSQVYNSFDHVPATRIWCDEDENDECLVL